ncbi:unnamed protein product, partial [Mesorhabditis spiculigera]
MKPDIIRKRWESRKTEYYNSSIFSQCKLEVIDPFAYNINATYKNLDPTRNCDRNYKPSTIIKDNDLYVGKSWKSKIAYCHVRKEEHAPPKPPNFQPDVHIILLDSVSSTLARRALPKTLKYIEEEMGGVMMHHWNRVADNSQLNGFAFTYGKRITDIYRGFAGAENLRAEWCFDEYCKNFLDNKTVIFKEYELAGYKTMHITEKEDIYTYPDCLGFEQRHTTHDYRPMDNLLKREPFLRGTLIQKCVEDWQMLLNQHANFAKAYKGTPKFGLTWVTNLVHESANFLWHADTFMQKYFRSNSKHFDNSFLFFMGDHGARIGPTVDTEMGSREINNPMLMLIVPKFLRNNRQATNYTNFDFVPVLNPNPNNGTSLLRPMGPFKDRNHEAMGRLAVRSINDLLAAEKLLDLCAEVVFEKMDSVYSYDPENGTHLYEVRFYTTPNHGLFRAKMAGLISSPETLKIWGPPIRVNKYGATSQCIVDSKPDFRPYCYCKNQ